MLASLLLFAVYLYVAARQENRTVRFVMYAFVLMLLGVSLLPALRRPSSQNASFFPIQQIIVPFYWYIILFAIATSTYLKRYRGNSTPLLIALCLLLIGWQQTFGFYKDESLKHTVDSKNSIVRLQALLTPAFNELTAHSEKPLYVPNLRGVYINPYVFGNDLYKYRTFLGISSQIQLLDVRSGPFLASTSKEFIQALQKDKNLRSLYFAYVELEEGYQTNPLQTKITPKEFESNGSYSLVLSPSVINPAKLHTLLLDIEVPKESEKIILDISFQNDYGLEGPLGFVRLDQFSTLLKDEAGRRYVLSVDLNQIYAYALSSSISNLRLTFKTSGHYTVHSYSVESN